MTFFSHLFLELCFLEDRVIAMLDAKKAIAMNKGFKVPSPEYSLQAIQSVNSLLLHIDGLQWLGERQIERVEAEWEWRKRPLAVPLILFLWKLCNCSRTLISLLRLKMLFLWPKELPLSCIILHLYRWQDSLSELLKPPFCLLPSYKSCIFRTKQLWQT